MTTQHTKWYPPYSNTYAFLKDSILFSFLKKTVFLWKCFLYRHSYNLYGTICFCWIALLLFQDWLFPIWFLRNYLKSFFFGPAAFDCMVIVMRCKIDESVICKTLLQWMDSHWRTLQLRIGHETASIKPSFISKHQSLCAAGHFWGQFNGLYHISPQTVTGRGNVMTKWLAHYYVNFHHQLPEEANKTVMTF